MLKEKPCARVRGIMSTAQDSPKRRKQKARRTKQLAEWREKKAGGGKTGKAATPSGSAKKKAAAK
jgi:hypothetical protein